jgi:probable F420-dependent oxidoreductase
MEVGIGAGWLRPEYDATCIPFDSAGTRIDRLAEAIPLIKRLWTEESVDHQGDFYNVTGLTLVPRPAQTPHPPVMVGGGGKRVLSLASRLAEIVAINPRATPAGIQDRTDMTAEASERKVSWIQEAAGQRWGNIELNIVLLRVVPTDNRDAAAEDLANEFALTKAEITDSPHILIGTVDQMAETLRERRERYGISYISVTEDGLDTFAPVIERLTAI